jgi:hypothetical protein
VLRSISTSFLRSRRQFEDGVAEPSAAMRTSLISSAEGLGLPKPVEVKAD